MAGNFSLTPSGVLGEIGQNIPYTPVPLDPTTQGLINQQGSEATGNIGGLMNQNVQAQGTAQMNSGPSAQQSAAKMGGSGASPYMNQAIRNQYNQTAQKSINQIMQRNNWNAPGMQSQMLKQYAMNAYSQQQVETNNYQGLVNAYNSTLAARAGVISSVLGMGGAAAGTAAQAYDPQGPQETAAAKELGDINYANTGDASQPLNDPNLGDSAYGTGMNPYGPDYSLSNPYNQSQYSAGDLANVPGSSDSNMWTNGAPYNPSTSQWYGNYFGNGARSIYGGGQ